MSIVNIFVGSDEVLVGADLERQNVDGTISRVGKIFILPHLPALITLRGSFWLGTALFCGAIDFADFDTLHGRFLRLLVDTEASLRALFGASCPPTLGQEEVVLAGHSPRLGRMTAWRYLQAVPQAGYVGEEIEGHMLAPRDAAIGELPPPSTHAAMAEAAKLQSAWLKSRGGAGGSDLVFARLTKHFVTVVAPVGT
jgi:hypothetical protein